MSSKPDPKRNLDSILGTGPKGLGGLGGDRLDALDSRPLMGTRINPIRALVGRAAKEQDVDLAGMDIGSGEKVSEIVKPGDTEVQRIGDLLNAFFGEFGTASRSYAFAKHSENMTPEIEAFMQNPSPDVEPAELRKIGWPSFKQLMSDLATPIMHIQQARRATQGDDLESADIKSDTARRIRDTKILPVLKRYDEAHGHFEFGQTEEERVEDRKKRLPGLAMVVETVMLDSKASGLHYALHKKTHGETLTEKDKKLLADNADIVETAESMMASAGMGWATAPCNQAYGAAGRASGEWTKFMGELRSAIKAEGESSEFTAMRHIEAAMQHHRDALKEFKETETCLKPVCELVESMIDSNGKTTLTNEALDKASALVATTADIANDQRVTFNVRRITNAVERVQKQESSALKTIEPYIVRSQHVSAFAEISRAQNAELVKKIGVLKEAIKDTDGTMPISDPKFRDVYMAIRGLTDRLDMMSMSAEQLHNDMGRITGQFKPEWIAKETEGEKDQFQAPANPSERVKRVAEEIQRTCVSQQEAAQKRREELLQVVEEIGGSVDRFDIIHDFFTRLKNRVGEQVADMQARQDKWDVAHPGAGAAKGV